MSIRLGSSSAFSGARSFCAGGGHQHVPRRRLLWGVRRTQTGSCARKQFSTAKPATLGATKWPHASRGSVDMDEGLLVLPGTGPERTWMGRMTRNRARRARGWASELPVDLVAHGLPNRTIGDCRAYLSLDAAARFLEVGLELLGLVAVDALLDGLGASSTSALASFRPRPVAARTTLITWIFLSPGPVSTTSTVSAPPRRRRRPAVAGGGRSGSRDGGGRDAELLLERLDALATARAPRCP